MSYMTGTISGNAKHPGSGAISGKPVYITASVPVYDIDGNVAIDTETVKVDVNPVTGAWQSPQLPATDDLTLDPSGVTYKVTVPGRGFQPVSGVVVLAGQDTEYATIAPRTTPPTYATYGVTRIGELSGDVDAQELAGVLDDYLTAVSVTSVAGVDAIDGDVPAQNLADALDDYLGAGTGTVTSVAGVDPDVSGDVVAQDLADALSSYLGAGAGTVTSINNIDPDTNGDVTLTAANVGAQAADTDLDAIAALSTTPFGRSLLTQATATAARSTLGLGSASTAASTDFQAADTDLAAIALLATTPFGRSLLTQADAPATRTTLGLGTSATVDTGTVSGKIPLLGTGGVLPIARIATGTPTGTKFVRDDGTLVVPTNTLGEVVNNVATAGAAVTLPSPLVASDHEINLSADCAVTLPTGFDATREYSIVVWLVQPSSGGSYSWLVSWVGSIRWLDGGTPPIVATGQDAVTAVTLVTKDGGVTWRGSASVVDPGNQGVSLVYASTVATDAATGDVFDLTLTGNAIMGAPSGLTKNKKILYRITQDATGSRTITWDTIFRFSTDVPVPFLSTSGHKTDYVGFIYNAADSKLDCLAVSRGY